MTEFKKRVFGCAIVKAINSNYNADFSGQPRTLPNGQVYATDKAFKYTVKNYLKDVFVDDKVLYFKRYNTKKDGLVPYSLLEAFCVMFPDMAELSSNKQKAKDEGQDGGKKNDESIKLKAAKNEVAKALLDCIDVRLFGATFAAKSSKKEDSLAISVHGPVQICYGVNQWKLSQIYTDQIMSPFRNPKENDENDDNVKQMTTLGRQSRLDEGHYLHHFSINPNNLCDILANAGENAQTLSSDDIDKLKEAMRRGATWYDSASKAGCENEMLVWVELKENSKIVLPNFTTLIDLKDEKKDGKYVYDFEKLTTELGKFQGEISFVEVFYNKQMCELENLPEETVKSEL